MKILKYLLFILPFLLAPNVFAQQINVTNKIRYNPDTSGGTYYGDEIFLGGYNGQFSVNTRYNGQLSQIVFYLKDSDYSFQLNKTYTITLNMATSDWRNNFMGPLVYGSNSDGTITSGSPNWYVSNTFSFVSMKKIKFNIKPMGTIKPLTKFTIYSTNVNTTAFTGVNNWNLSSIIIDDNSSSGGSSGGSTPTPTPDSSQQIINNANENTQDIINNSDKNTSDIIENNNHNSDIINESINSQCKNGLLVLSDDYYMKDNYYLDENGNEVADSSSAISIYFVIKPNSLYTISSPGGLAGETYSVCLYDSNKNILPAGSRICKSVNEYTNGINSGPYAQYMRITIPKRWYATLGITGPICNNFTKESIDNASSAIGGAIQGGASGIIDNQNANTDKEIESQKVCSSKIINFSNTIVKNRYLDSSGVITDGYNWGITDFLSVGELVPHNIIGNLPNYCFYDEFKQLISCYSNLTMSENVPVNFPNNAKYIRLSIYSDNRPYFTYSYCSNGNQAMNDSINDLNDSINNPNVDSGTGEGFFDNFTSQDFGLSQIITIPLNTIQGLTSKTCVPLQVPIPFTNSNITLPCMTEIYETKFPSIYNLWKIVSFGIIAYLISIDIFHIVKGFKDPESDKVEVLDL